MFRALFSCTGRGGGPAGWFDLFLHDAAGPNKGADGKDHWFVRENL